MRLANDDDELIAGKPGRLVSIGSSTIPTAPRRSQVPRGPRGRYWRTPWCCRRPGGSRSLDMRAKTRRGGAAANSWQWSGSPAPSVSRARALPLRQHQFRRFGAREHGRCLDQEDGTSLGQSVRCRRRPGGTASSAAIEALAADCAMLSASAAPVTCWFGDGAKGAKLIRCHGLYSARSARSTIQYASRANTLGTPHGCNRRPGHLGRIVAWDHHCLRPARRWPIETRPRRSLSDTAIQATVRLSARR